MTVYARLAQHDIPNRQVDAYFRRIVHGWKQFRVQVLAGKPAFLASEEYLHVFHKR
jgi:hypothetical protein